MSSHLYNVLIVGCGDIAGGFDASRASHLPSLSHAGAYTKHEGFKLFACVDPDHHCCAAFARRWEVENQASTIADLSLSPGLIDVVSICSPTELHHEHLKQVLSLRPKMVFCEKPLALDVSAATEIITVYREHDIDLVVNYSRQWDPCVAELENKVRAGCWGDIRSVVGHYNKGILNNGSHMLELLLRLLGQLELVATGMPVFDFWKSDPTVAVFLTANQGAVPVYLNPSHASDYAYFELEIVFELGVLRMESGGLNWQFRMVEPSKEFLNYQTLTEAKFKKGRYMEALESAINNLYNRLETVSSVKNTNAFVIEVQNLCADIQKQALKKSEFNN